MLGFSPLSAQALGDDGESKPSGSGLLADSILFGSPTVGSPTFVNQHHSLLGENILLSSDVSTSDFYQKHGLSAAGVLVPNPAVTHNPVAQKHKFFAGSVATESPQVSVVRLSIPVHLSANSLGTQSPVIGNPAVNTIIKLLADKIQTAPTVVQQTNFGQNPYFVAQGLLSDSPKISRPRLLQKHEIFAEELVTGSPIQKRTYLNGPKGRVASLYEDSSTTVLILDAGNSFTMNSGNNEVVFDVV